MYATKWCVLVLPVPSSDGDLGGHALVVGLHLLNLHRKPVQLCLLRVHLRARQQSSVTAVTSVSSAMAAMQHMILKVRRTYSQERER